MATPRAAESGILVSLFRRVDSARTNVRLAPQRHPAQRHPAPGPGRPLLRRAEPERLVFWLATSCPTAIELVLASEGEAERRIRLAEGTHSAIRIGTHAWLHLLDVALDPPLPCARLVDYDLRLAADGREPAGIAEWAPHLLYPGRQRASLVLKPRLDQLLHGSCRKPHHPAADGLLQVDRLLEENLLQAESRPALLMMSGDQVYADDVAGPMLVAIHGLIRRLGLYGEHLEGALVDDSEALYAHPATYYRREDLLPAFKSNEALRERFFGGVKKPIFTSANAHNHLVGLAEVLAMYLLVWSPAPWRLVRLEPPPGLDARHAQRFADERRHIEAFRDGLPGVARALAHISSLMIFDDHDITDDWNLSARWELTAYGHPFSRRIIGNALLAYLLCQGWGNDPQHCGEWLAPVAAPDGGRRGRRPAALRRAGPPARCPARLPALALPAAWQPDPDRPRHAHPPLAQRAQPGPALRADGLGGAE